MRDWSNEDEAAAYRARIATAENEIARLRAEVERQCRLLRRAGDFVLLHGDGPEDQTFLTEIRAAVLDHKEDAALATDGKGE